MAVKVSTLASIGIVVGIIVGAVFFFAPRFSETTSEQPDFIITVDPFSPTIVRRESGNVRVEVQSLNNFNSRVTLNLIPPASPPGNVTAKLEKPSLIPFPNLPVATNAMFNVGENAVPGVYNYTVTGEGGGITRSATISLQVVLKPAIIGLEPGDQTVLVGSQFKVNVTISDVVDMFAWGLELTYDSALLENVSITLGPDWQAKVANGEAVHFGFGSTKGKIESALTFITPTSFSGNTTILLMEFRALPPPTGTPTKTVLQFLRQNTQVVKFVGGQGQEISIRVVDGNVTIVPSSSSPLSSSPIQGIVSQGPFLETSDTPIRRGRDLF